MVANVITAPQGATAEDDYDPRDLMPLHRAIALGLLDLFGTRPRVEDVRRWCKDGVGAGRGVRVRLRTRFTGHKYLVTEAWCREFCRAYRDTLNERHRRLAELTVDHGDRVQRAQAATKMMDRLKDERKRKHRK